MIKIFNTEKEADNFINLLFSDWAIKRRCYGGLWVVEFEQKGGKINKKGAKK